MGGGNLHFRPQENASVPVTVGNTKLSDAPVLFFVYFHKAFRAQLVELRRFATDAAEADSFSRDLAVVLSRKFEFLKLVYKYHSAAEDEVIFSALDARVKNIASIYSLEHAGTDDLFTSIFHWLHALEEEIESISDILREVILCISTIQSSICQHMLKEEQQVFPLLIEKFSYQEQASLVWQFICSVPVMVLEDFLPWMMSYLSHEERIEVQACIKDVVPTEDSLQQVISSWLLDDSQSSCADCTEIMKRFQYVVSTNMENSLQTHPSSGCFQRFWQWGKRSLSIPNVGHNPIHGLQIFQNAIEKDLRDIQEELCQAKFPSLSLDLGILMARLNFFADVLVSYSNAFKKLIHPVLEDMTDRGSATAKQFNIDNCLENFQRLLYKSVDDKTRTDNFLLQLQEELDSLIVQVTKHFSVQRREVFTIISKECNHEMQRQLLYTSIHVLPLGLLKCVILWFSAHLSEEESQSILHFLSLEDSSPNGSFSRLLLQWLRFGYSGKTSVESLWKQLAIMFKVRCSCQKDHTEEASASFSHQAQLQLCQGSKVDLLVCPRKKNKSSTCFMTMDSGVGDMYETPYSSRMNQQMTFSEKLKPPLHLPDFFGEKNMDNPFITDLKPIDLLFFFHKAMKMDLDYLVCGSARLAADCRFLGEFQQRFHMIKFLYQIHSDAEDEVAFPALEAKGKLKNISHSFSIDHELEIKHFDKVSFILSEMSELNMLVSTRSSSAVDHRKTKYERLCLSLQEMCKSVHKLLSDHIQHEETELWVLFRNCFAIDEQEKIIGSMLGRISGEILKDMIPWLMDSLTSDEQLSAMSLWRQATRRTMFVEWLTEWYNGHAIQEEAGEPKDDPFGDSDPLEIVWKYLFEASTNWDRGSIGSNLVELPEKDLTGTINKTPSNNNVEIGNKEDKHLECTKSKKICRVPDKRGDTEQIDSNFQTRNPAQSFQMSPKANQFGQSMKYEQLLTMSQEELVAVIKKISSDSSLDPQKKSYIKQNLLMSRWNISQRIYNLEQPSFVSSFKETVPGQHPSYRDPHCLIFGCKHYKRNCKLLAPCCEKLFTCIRCHDEEADDHLVDRKLITKMMCMKCLLIQPIGSNCSNSSCKTSMGKYFCKICKLYDDERKIYHCPYCNLCRVGRGLGIDYFHCMKCNACMARTLVEHVCREKCLEDNCPICHEYIFTSSTPVKALPCGHLMHSTCFQEYTCSHYTCPICSKSLGDMQVYFKMLDALLAEEKMPDEYANKTQVILCNDCGRKGNAPYHWLYHKCTTCGSYNSRLL